MGWGRLRRLYGLQQSIRRRTGQDPLYSFSHSDVLMLLCASPCDLPHSMTLRHSVLAVFALYPPFNAMLQVPADDELCQRLCGSCS